MRTVPRLVYLICFLGIAIVAIIALNRVAQPSMATTLTRAVFLSGVCGAPGLIHRRVWPLAFVLLPIGCYLLVRTIMPVPEMVDGVAEQYRYYTQQLNLGATAYKTEAFPLDPVATPGLSLLFAFVAYWLVGAAAFLALSLRRPTPAVALLLILLGYGLTVDSTTRILWPGLAFVVLTACLFVVSRGIGQEGWRLRDTLAGGLVGALGAGLALGLLLAAPSVVATPWQDWRTWDPFGTGGPVYSFNWLQNYPRLLDPANDAVVMTVESPTPSYWRASALDTFTGTAWVTSQAFLQRIEPVPQDDSADSEGRYHSYLYSIPSTEPTPAGETVTQVFQTQAVYTNYFFTGGDPQSLVLDEYVPLRMNGMRSLRVSTALGPTLRYHLVSVIPKLTPADLVGLGSDYPEDIQGYLLLPFSRLSQIEGPDKDATWQNIVTETGPDGWEWTKLLALNRSIVRDAVDPYQITLRIEQYLRQFYRYSLSPPVGEYSSPYAAFLFDSRTGYCQHFAGAMALLLRFNGIPSRVAVGFTSGEKQGDDAYVVSANNAHAWVEVYFPTIGWTAFDPTPGRNLPSAGPSSTSPGFINPYINSSPPSGGTLPTIPVHGGLENGAGGGGEGVAAKNGGRLNWAAWLAGPVVFIVIVLGWPVGRSVWRRRRIHRGPPEQRLQASLALLRTELADYRAPVKPAYTLEETLDALHAYLGIEPDPTFVARADAVLFGGRKATAADVDQAERKRRQIKARLREHHGWARTLMALYGIPRQTGGSKLQYRDEKHGRKTQETTLIQPGAL